MNRIYTAKCQTYNQEAVNRAVHDCFEAFGGASAILSLGKRGKDSKTVLVKANLVKASKIEDAATTHPAVIEAVAREFRALGATVLIGDCPAIMPSTAAMKNLYRITGLDKAAQNTDSELIYNFDSETVYAVFDGKKQTFPIWKPVFDADIIINCAKLKTHSFATMTGAAKNLFGVLPGLHKSAKHAENPSVTDFVQMLVVLCEYVRKTTPVFSIIDGIIGMEGNGPTGGTPKVANVVIASDDPYCADLAGLKVMGIKPETVPLAKCAMEKKLSPMSLDECECLGAPLNDLVTPFKMPKKTNLLTMALSAIFPSKKFGKGGAFPRISKKRCVVCGKCAEICPVQAATKKDGVIEINRKECIRCYCCHEVCPARAIDI